MFATSEIGGGGGDKGIVGAGRKGIRDSNQKGGDAARAGNRTAREWTNSVILKMISC
jgi:hypothetical protein